MEENLAKHIYHPFYKKVDKLVDDVRMMQIRKGAEKYPEPFTPSSWTGKELAIHALQELRDGQVYVVGLYERIEELEKDNKCYREAIQKLIQAKYNCDGFGFNEIAGDIAEEFEALEGESE